MRNWLCRISFKEGEHILLVGWLVRSQWLIRESELTKH